MTREIHRLGLVGDNIYTVDAAGRPVEALVRRVVDGRWVGSGSYVVNGSIMSVRLWGPEPGSSEIHELEVPDRFSLIMHPVFLDGWQFLSYARASGGEQTVFVVNSSTRPDGADGPLIHVHENRLLIVAEEEVVTLAGGTYLADHFRLLSHLDHDPFDVALDLWVEPTTSIMLRMEWPDYGGLWEVREMETLRPRSEEAR